MTTPTSPSIAGSELNKDASRRLGRPNPEAPPLARCKFCQQPARESRFGAPCYDCAPPHPVAAAEMAVRDLDLMFDQMMRSSRVAAATTREFYRLGALMGRVNTNRVPSKAAGRKGTRRAWKRAHPPGSFTRLWRDIFDEVTFDEAVSQ